MSLQEVAEQAGCSTAYVHKLEQDRVRTPSPRVLGGLARALSLDYGLLMGAAGYEPPSSEAAPSPPVAARFSNAHIVQLLEALQADVAQLRQDLDRLAAGR
jgi:HTH-type transcriptional regulator, competence development regulator